ncbi:GNAT family N-acetyltransferase [Vibrio sp. vnigr-6D03]|uniref:GNAT family N-acetyltransferase n=1 Tax=Vibrio sp. vnigr-6D03 TaxID=2058088 RepID=UPI000C3277FF|nr:GNAT family N-acetyltransferase [Vibrio sp. vnigr-6D03]PKF77455.1 GNAT family N-acetyltransferase [Vibrio sp. vnigr-6D03]
MKIRTGSLDECINVANAIPEFVHKETVLNLAKRLKDKVNLVLIAEDGDNLLGFKIGYELDKDSFYSWFGGVLPEGRKRGVAQLLLEEQEKWAIKSGYKQINVKSRNEFPSMLRLLIRNGYLVDMVEKYPDILESRIHFIKKIKK